MKSTVCLVYVESFTGQGGRSENFPEGVNGAIPALHVGSKSPASSHLWGDDTSYSTYLMHVLAFGL